SLVIHDNTGTYVDTGMVSDDNNGTFTIDAKNNGYLIVDVDPNSDPGTLWDLLVEPEGTPMPHLTNRGAQEGHEGQATHANSGHSGPTSPSHTNSGVTTAKAPHDNFFDH